MSKIGYGRTQEQIIETVKAILDKDGRNNPFVDNRPGRDWWHGFLRRHPKLCFRSPEQLALARASACSEQKLYNWYCEFEKFLDEHNVQDPDKMTPAMLCGFVVISVTCGIMQRVPTYPRRTVQVLLIWIGIAMFV